MPIDCLQPWCTHERKQHSRPQLQLLCAASSISINCQEQQNMRTIMKNTKNHNLWPISIFCLFPFVCQIWYSGLDLNQFCAPDRIMEMSNSSICWPFGEKWLSRPMFLFKIFFFQHATMMEIVFFIRTTIFTSQRSLFSKCNKIA